jgi:hypothetical protein
VKNSFPAGFLAIVVLACGSAHANGKQHAQPEQLEFSAEDEGVKRPVVVPDEVMAILSQDELVRNVLESENVPSEKLPPAWFSASTIHLSGPGEVDLVVMAESELRGANVNVFWVFCPTVHGYELVLTAPAHDLVVKKARWRGHREIELMSATAVQFSTVLLRWDGRKYAAYQPKSEEIK